MSGRVDIDALVTDWLNDEAPPRAPRAVLSTALERVADVGQERPIGLGLGRWAGGSASLRWAILGAVLAAALVGAIAGAGAVLFRGPLIAPSGMANGWVAFTVEGRTRQSESDIWLVRSGVEEFRLTGSDNDDVREVCPQFSPDGTRLAYAEGPANALDDGGVSVVIVAMDATGQPAGPVARLPVEGWGHVCPKWSPDSRSVAYLAFEPMIPGPPGPTTPGVPTLWIGHLDGTATRIGGWGETNTVTQLDWSPDGTSVAATEITGSRIWILPLDGRDARLFQGAPQGVQFEGARWSPDGTRIAVVARRYVGDLETGMTGVGNAIRIYRASGTLPPVELEGGDQFAWSPDGDRLVYVRAGEESGREVTGLVSASAAGDNLQVIASEPRGIGGLTWAPDATRVLYIAGGSPAGELMSVSAAGDAPPVALTQQPHEFEWTTSEDVSWQAVSP